MEDKQHSLHKLKMNIKVLVCHHKEYPFVKNECFLPVQVGKSLSDISLDYAEPDNTGQNISEKNASWCELTALYWAWKNLSADYYGLMHYRRMLHFRAREGCYLFHDITEKQIQTFGWTADAVRESCQQFDIMTGPVWRIHPAGLPEKVMNAWDFYGREHDIRSLEIVVDIVKKNYQAHYLPLLQSLSDTTCVWGNIAVMKSLYFHEYCQFLFGVLEEAERRIEVPTHDSYQRRVFGFLAERLLNAWLVYARGRYPDLRAGTLPLVYGVTDKPLLDNNLKNDSIPAKRKTDKINICMSFDDNYAPHADVTITSLIKNVAPEQAIDFYIICDARLSAANREKICSAKTQARNVTFHFLSVSPDMLPALPLNRKYISLNTYYRLLMQRLLPADIDKILYLDSDIVVCQNVAELWETQLEGYCLAGVHDEGGMLQARRLYPLSHPDYVNAGILLFNMKEINRRFSDMFITCSEHYYRNRDQIILQDQDILNITFKGSIKVLPLKWNVSSRMFTFNELEHRYTQVMVSEAVNAPAILHYTDSNKPWGIFCGHPLRHLYWQYRSMGNYATLSLRERFIRRYQGIIQYKAAGSSVLLRLYGTELDLRGGVRLVRRISTLFKN